MKPGATQEKPAHAAPGSRLRLDLAFVGTGLSGWQVQARGRTAQGLVDDALRAIDHRGGKVVGCSRTDSGVHVRLFAAHVDTALSRSPSAVLAGLNANLPPQIRIYMVSRASAEFHARYSCVRKTYRYHLHTGPAAPPHLAPFVWPWRGKLDLPAMQSASALFRGDRDFAAFTTADGRAKNTRRAVEQCLWEERDELLVLHVSGKSFLHRMVRCMAGALVAAGTGRLAEADLEKALSGDTSGPQIPALPAQGLALWSVEYPEEPAPGESAGAIPAEPLFPL